LIGGCAKGRDHDLFDGNSFDVGQLLAECVPFGGDPANNAMGCAELLHHHVEVAV
jgi:hypothetical protein